VTLHIASGRPESLDVGGCTYRILDDGAASAGRLAVLVAELAPGWSGPPQHVHREFDESFFVLDGTVRFSAAEDSLLAESGQLVTAPMGTPHTFGNADATLSASVLITIAPERYLGYFRELADLPRGTDDRPDAAQVAELMRRHATDPWPPPEPTAAPERPAARAGAHRRSRHQR
jgi:mannose-6-phosphate isomerase-like protein (cupin superfamily)